jgi:hypothetical protein
MLLNILIVQVLPVSVDIGVNVIHETVYADDDNVVRMLTATVYGTIVPYTVAVLMLNLALTLFRLMLHWLCCTTVDGKIQIL